MTTFYNPYKKQNQQQPIQGRNLQAGANASGNGMFGNGVTYDMLGTGQWGTGESLQGSGRVSALKAIRDARTTANPEDYAAMEEVRGYYRNQLGDLPSMEGSSFGGQAGRGIANVRGAMAAPGRGMGAGGYAGVQGNVNTKAISDYVNGMIQARAQEGQQANMINRGLGNLQAQDLKERSMQLYQAQSYADLINRLVAADQNRQDELAGRAAQEYADRMNLIAGIVTPLAEYGGGYMAGKMQDKGKEKTTRDSYYDDRTGAYDSYGDDKLDYGEMYG